MPPLHSVPLDPADDALEGELGFAACRVLMKALWLGRLARPDLVKPIGDLASSIQKWSRNCDKQLHRLVCYINSTVNSTLVGTVQDSTDELHLSLYVDADFAGERDAKSTSGGFLVLSGPHAHFRPTPSRPAPRSSSMYFLTGIQPSSMLTLGLKT